MSLAMRVPGIISSLFELVIRFLVIVARKVSPVVVVGVILTSLCIFLYINETKLVRTLEHYAYDKFMGLVNSSPKTDDVVVVDLDDKSLQTVGQWPWSRYLLATMTGSIFEYGAKVVAYDVQFSEKDRTSPDVLKEALNADFGLDVKVEGVPDELKDFDKVFADVLEFAEKHDRHTILGCFMNESSEHVANAQGDADAFYKSYLLTKGEEGATNINALLVQADGLQAAIPELDKVSYTAFINAIPDEDNVVRRVPLLIALGDKRIYPSLALEAVRLFKGARQCILTHDELGAKNLRVGDVLVPTDRHGRIVVNYRTVEHAKEGNFYTSFKRYSAVDVLGGNIPDDAFAGKIVFVGTSAVGLRDMRATPLCPEFSGVEIHATIVDNILHGDILQFPYWMMVVQTIVLLLMGIFLTTLIERGRSWLSFLITFLMILASIRIALFMFRQHHMVFIPAWLVVSIVIIYPVLTTIKFWQEEYQKKQVRNMFGTMVSQDVLQYLEKNPESFSLSGQRAEATMFFSDVAGFTTISESLEPEGLSRLLNRYLSPMTNIIMQRNGYVDKYEGDAIMAEWGVPFPVDDHAVQACFAALEQQAELAELRPWLKKAFGHNIYVRMGLNSGVVTAGNMGSDRRFQYTVMGDAVNQAARFEPANKDYGTHIMIGESTYREAGDTIEVRLLDKIVVMGKTQPIQIYELLAKKGELRVDRYEVVELYEKALRMHWERRWNEALKCLDSALALDQGDAPSVKMRERIISYRDVLAPPENWAGEYVRATKD